MASYKNRSEGKKLIVVVFGPPSSGKTRLGLLIKDKLKSQKKFNYSQSFNEQARKETEDTKSSGIFEMKGAFCDPKSEWLESDDTTFLFFAGQCINNQDSHRSTGAINEDIFRIYKNRHNNHLFLILINPFTLSKDLAQEAFYKYTGELRKNRYNNGHTIGELLQISAELLFSINSAEFAVMKKKFIENTGYKEEFFDTYDFIKYDQIEEDHKFTTNPTELDLTKQFCNDFAADVFSEQESNHVSAGTLYQNLPSGKTQVLFTHQDLISKCGFDREDFEKRSGSAFRRFADNFRRGIFISTVMHEISENAAKLAIKRNPDTNSLGFNELNQIIQDAIDDNKALYNGRLYRSRNSIERWIERLAWSASR